MVIRAYINSDSAKFDTVVISGYQAEDIIFLLCHQAHEAFNKLRRGGFNGVVSLANLLLRIVFRTNFTPMIAGRMLKGDVLAKTLVQQRP